MTLKHSQSGCRKYTECTADEVIVRGDFITARHHDEAFSSMCTVLSGKRDELYSLHSARERLAFSQDPMKRSSLSIRIFRRFCSNRRSDNVPFYYRPCVFGSVDPSKQNFSRDSVLSGPRARTDGSS